MNQSKPVIVIAEDSRVQGKVLQQRLIAAGYDAHVGVNGELALQLVREHKPNIVVSDIEMPKMTGYELCNAIKTSPDLRHIPVILLSTLSDAEDIIRGLAAGADNYITKPYDINFLISRIEDLRANPIQENDQPSTDSTIVTLGGRPYEVRAGRKQTLN